MSSVVRLTRETIVTQRLAAASFTALLHLSFSACALNSEVKAQECRTKRRRWYCEPNQGLAFPGAHRQPPPGPCQEPGPPQTLEESRARPEGKCEQRRSGTLGCREAGLPPESRARVQDRSVDREQTRRQTLAGISVTTHPLAASRFPWRSSGCSRPSLGARTSGPLPPGGLRLLVTQATV